ncbi:hypothetical protein FB446DRAFT_799083 [Lentinula raphanica]|nr:hypothetical protein FB446DRAFT_799083 [Lentinula raphanica]
MSAGRSQSSQSIAQISWPTNRISTCLCDKCNHSIHLDAQLLDFHNILEKSRSGYYPTAAERVAYLGMIEETRSEIEHFETELSRLRGVSQKLEEQKMLLQAYEAGIKHAISPIQSLPLEILGIIFQYVCCGKDATDIANNYNLRCHFPTLDMSTVCIRWYKLVISMPILWTSFGTDGRDPLSQSLVRTFLKRSRSYLIDFRLSDTVRGDYSPSPLAVVAHCDRWRRVSIAGTAGFVCESFLRPLVECEKTPSHLISLDLDCYLPFPFEIPITFLSLKSLILRGLILEFEIPQYMVTTLSLSEVTCNDALKVLLTLPKIERLKVEDIEEYYDMEDDAPIVLNKLEILTLTYPIATDFLAAIKCPRLTCLYLCNHRAFQFQSMIMFSFLGQTHCALTHLGIKCISLDHGELLQLFRLVPLLTHLDVEEAMMLFQMADTMTWTLKLLAGHRHLDPQGAEAMPEISSDADLDGDASYGYSVNEDSELEAGGDVDRSDKDATLSHHLKDHDNIQELLLPQLVELDLVLKPRNELLLDVVRSRLENSLGTSTNRPRLQTLRIRYPDPHVIGPAVYQQFEALKESLDPFKEGGLNAEFKLPPVRL